MKKYAVLNSSNLVTNIIIAESLGVAESVTSCNCIFIAPDNETCGVGKLYSNGIFVDPPVEEETP